MLPATHYNPVRWISHSSRPRPAASSSAGVPSSSCRSAVPTARPSSSATSSLTIRTRGGIRRRGRRSRSTSSPRASPRPFRRMSRGIRPRSTRSKRRSRPRARRVQENCPGRLRERPPRARRALALALRAPGHAAAGHVGVRLLVSDPRHGRRDAGDALRGGGARLPHDGAGGDAAGRARRRAARPEEHTSDTQAGRRRHRAPPRAVREHRSRPARHAAPAEDRASDDADFFRRVDAGEDVVRGDGTAPPPDRGARRLAAQRGGGALAARGRPRREAADVRRAVRPRARGSQRARARRDPQRAVAGGARARRLGRGPHRRGAPRPRARGAAREARAGEGGLRRERDEMTNVERARRTIADARARGAADFCVCAGSRNAPLLAVLAVTPDIRVWSFVDERSAAFFALGRAQLLGPPAAVVTTSGTAVAELLPAVVEAFYSGTPLIVITADRPARYRGTGAPQCIEQEGIFGPYVGGCVVHVNVEFDEPLIDDEVRA